MPRQTRKKSLLNPKKSQLLFVEQPKNGPRHDYGPQCRSAITPRTFSSEQPRQKITVSSWVSPQFISFRAGAAARGGQKRKKNQCSTNTITTTPILSLHRDKRKAACKYPTLSFKTSTSVLHRSHKDLLKKTTSCAGDAHKAESVLYPQGDKIHKNNDKMVSPNNQDEAPIDIPRLNHSFNARGHEMGTSKVTVTPCRTSEILKTPLVFAVGNQRTVHTPASKRSDTPCTSTVFTPPHVETPEVPHNQHCLSTSILQLFFSPHQPNSPQRTQNMGLLVKDTPERDYGLKVTWRRRKKLMKLLTEQGRLSVNETMISNQ